MKRDHNPKGEVVDKILNGREIGRLAEHAVESPLCESKAIDENKAEAKYVARSDEARNEPTKEGASAT